MSRRCICFAVPLGLLTWLVLAGLVWVGTAVAKPRPFMWWEMPAANATLGYMFLTPWEVELDIDAPFQRCDERKLVVRCPIVVRWRVVDNVEPGYVGPWHRCHDELVIRRAAVGERARTRFYAVTCPWGTGRRTPQGELELRKRVAP